MNTPIEALEINLRDFENADENVKQLATFCDELLRAIKFTLSK